MAKKFLTIDGKHFEIAYEILNPNQPQSIVFLHGWGSNKEIMKQAFGRYFTDFTHLYIDLPGFGQSQNTYILDTQKYADMMRIFLDSLGIQDAMIVGHSFGGKIATLLAPKELVLLSSAGIVCPKSLKVKIKIFIAKTLRRLGLSSRALRSSDADGLNEAMYQTFKNVVDEDFTSVFSTFSSRAYIFWGNQDRATPLKSGQIIHRLISNSAFKSFDGDHYFFLHYGGEIQQQILEWRDRLE